MYLASICTEIHESVQTSSDFLDLFSEKPNVWSFWGGVFKHLSISGGFFNHSPLMNSQMQASQVDVNCKIVAQCHFPANMVVVPCLGEKPFACHF